MILFGRLLQECIGMIYIVRHPFVVYLQQNTGLDLVFSQPYGKILLFRICISKTHDRGEKIYVQHVGAWCPSHPVVHETPVTKLPETEEFLFNMSPASKVSK
jgi:hypothetical protein